MGEEPEFADFAAFKKAVATKSKIVAAKPSDGEAEFTGANGKQVSIRFAAKPTETGVWRDGKVHDLAEHARHLYRTADSKSAVIEQKWLDGTLTVWAGKAAFTATVSEKGAATFKND